MDDAVNELRPSAALVLETNNLDGADAADTLARLTALMRRLRAQTLPLGALAEVVLTHGGISAEAADRLSMAAGAPLRFVDVGRATGYYEAKNAGFLATTAEVVIFADGDCWPEPRWLETLLAPFAEGALAVAGRTTYRDTVLGDAATAMDFLYWPGAAGEGTVRNLYANNVAFRRSIFTSAPFPPPDRLHRGSCALLGMDLERRGVPIRFASEAVTLHPLPVGGGAWLRFRLRRGEDTAELTRPLCEAYLPRRFAWLGRTGALASMAVLGARFGFGARSLVRARHAPARRRAAALGSAAGLTLADAAGALARNAGLRGVGPRGEDAPLEAWED